MFHRFCGKNERTILPIVAAKVTLFSYNFDIFYIF